MYNKLYVLILIYMRARRRKVVQVVFGGCGSGWQVDMLLSVGVVYFVNSIQHS